MIKLNNKAECCGCAACAEICPKGCITMCSDAEGFRYPQFNENQCIQCDLCVRSCPVQNAQVRGDSVLQTLIGYHKLMDVRLASSSGGIFTLIAEDVLKNGGTVYGAAFDSDLIVHHVRINSVSDLPLVQGSKYLQSRIDESYRQVKEDLNSGKKVLFSGVACQVEALKRYLHREYDNLFTIDVLCHGVPSPYVWKKYLDWQGKKNNDSAETVNFRKKNRGWKRYEVEIHFKKGAVYHRPFNEDPYMRLFLQNICLRPSCHDCRFKSLERQSDVTLGDCWGIQNYMPSMDDDNGTSVILVHTEQGKALLERLSSKMNYQVAETDRALPSCSDSRKSVKPHSKRDTFFKRLAQSDDIEQLAKLVRPTMRKRIIGKLKKIRRHIKSKKQ